jgi:thioredoxin:protein disulfide reductase
VRFHWGRSPRARRSRTTAHWFLKMHESHLVAGHVMGLLPASLILASALTGVVANEGVSVTHRRALGLTFCYVAGAVLALAYTAIGLTALSCRSVPAALVERSWWPFLFAAMLVTFAIRLMAADLVQRPSQRQLMIPVMPQRLRNAYTCLAVGGAGALAGLTVSTIVVDRLGSILHLGTQAGSAAVSLMALLPISLCLGLLLSALGAGIASILQRAGTWTEGVKVFIGIELLATAVLILWPSLNDPLRVIFCALWLLVVIAELGLFSTRGSAGTIWRKPGRGLAAALAIWTTILLVHPVSGSLESQHQPARPNSDIAASD